MFTIVWGPLNRLNARFSCWWLWLSCWVNLNVFFKSLRVPWDGSAGFLPSSAVHQASVLTSWACNAPRWYWGQSEVGCFQKSFKNPFLALTLDRICYHRHCSSPQAPTVYTDKKKMGEAGDQPGRWLDTCSVSAAQLQWGQSSWPLASYFYSHWCIVD